MFFSISKGLLHFYINNPKQKHRSFTNPMILPNGLMYCLKKEILKYLVVGRQFNRIRGYLLIIFSVSNFALPDKK